MLETQHIDPSVEYGMGLATCLGNKFEQETSNENFNDGFGDGGFNDVEWMHYIRSHRLQLVVPSSEGPTVGSFPGFVVAGGMPLRS